MKPNSVQIVLWWPPSHIMSVDSADYATFEFPVILRFDLSDILKLRIDWYYTCQHWCFGIWI